MKWRGTRILRGDMTFSKKLPRVSDGFWNFDVASNQLSTEPHNCRSNSEKKTSHNIEQHLYGFDIEQDRTQDPKEPINSICDVNVSTVPTRFSFIKYMQAFYENYNQNSKDGFNPPLNLFSNISKLLISFLFQEDLIRRTHVGKIQTSDQLITKIYWHVEKTLYSQPCFFCKINIGNIERSYIGQNIQLIYLVSRRNTVTQLKKFINSLQKISYRIFTANVVQHVFITYERDFLDFLI